MRRVVILRTPSGVLSLKIQEFEVGKKHEAYQKATIAEGMTKSRLSDAEGGSAKGVIQEAKANAQQAERNSSDTWSTFIADPEG